jgi:hypothetical protein
MISTVPLGDDDRDQGALGGSMTIHGSAPSVLDPFPQAVRDVSQSPFFKA